MVLRAHFFTGDDEASVAEVQCFRKRLFVDQCAWDLQVMDGREWDEFDRPDTIHVLVSADAVPMGTFRAIRSDRPYLAERVFPQLAVVSGYPHRTDVWEISRFGVLNGSHTHELALINYALMFAFARQVDASALVAVAEVPYERFLRTLGIRTRRYGPPQVVGSDGAGRPLQLVAGEIPIAAQAPAHLARISTHLSGVEVHDKHVFGPARVSA